MNRYAHRVLIAMSYACAAVSLATALAGHVILANVFLGLTFVSAVCAVALVWHPRRQRSVARKSAATVVAMVPSGMFSLLLVLIAGR